LFDSVPVNKVREFEQEYLELLRTSKKEVLEALKAGKLEESSTSVMREVALDLARKFA
jgi:F-type H+-transporting ATPase subunit alpha